MIEFIGVVMGPYTYQGISMILTLIQGYICVGLFARRLERRSLFPLRLAAALVVNVLLCYLLAVWHTTYPTLPVRVLSYLGITLLNLSVLLFCWRDSAAELLMTFCSAMAAEWFVAKLYPLLQNLNGIDDRQSMSLFHGAEPGPVTDFDFVLSLLIQFSMYVILAALFTPRGRLQNNKRISRNVAALSIGTVILVNILICITRTFEEESWVLSMVTKAQFSALCLVILLACAGLFTQSEQEQQLATVQQLWRQDKAQFESIKANMDVINMKCHDLKHILNKIEGKLTEEEALSLRDAIEFYDSNIRTGNEVLDVVLCEKALTCQKNGITFSCMADGAKLDFLSPVQIYSLFGNIIDNAVEAVKRLTDPGDKVISLTCRQEGDALEIEESNYFAGDLSVKDGIPATSKQDRSRHGYGTRSIQYIAQQYGGSMEIKIVDNMFFLTVHFPLVH